MVIFGFVAVLFDGEDGFGFEAVAENFADFSEAKFYFFTDGGSDFVVSSGIFHVHERPSLKFLLELNWAPHLRSEVRSQNAEVKSLASSISTVAFFIAFASSF